MPPPDAARLNDLLDRAADQDPSAPAVIADGFAWTYAELRERAVGLAARLESHGVAALDRVAILDHNSPEFLAAYFAAPLLDAILVPLNVRLCAAEIAEILDQAQPRCLLRREGGELLCTELEITKDLRAPDGLAQIYYTSGSTGKPRGVMLTQANVLRHAGTAVEELRLDASDRWGHIAPMFHLADAWASFAITMARGVHVIVPGFDARTVLRAIERHRITITNLIPTMLHRIVKEPGVATFDLSSMRLVMSGGAPISVAAVREVLATFDCEYVQTYGMTETSPYLTLSLLHEHLKGLPFEERLIYMAKTGRPFGCVELEVRGPDGRPVPTDARTVGEIHARGPSVTPGYWQDARATAAAFDGGWLRTGDLATVDAEGYLDIKDRAKDMIVTGGENVYSTEVEAVLHEAPGVVEVAVVGVSDEEWGERVCAAVVLAEGATTSAAELAAFARARLASFKVPKEIRLVHELPRTGSGKLSKRDLRRAWLEGRT